MSKAQSESTVNPLNNPLILTNIFSHLTHIPDLKSVRLVSKLWKATSHSHWRASATIRLLWRKDISNFCKCQLIPDPDPVTVQSIFDENTLDICEYLELMETFDGKPFLRFRIINFCFFHPINDEVDIKINEFWDIYGSKMKYLFMDHANFHNHRLTPSYFWLREKCSNLKDVFVLGNSFQICRPQWLPHDKNGNLFRDESGNVMYSVNGRDCKWGGMWPNGKWILRKFPKHKFPA